MTLFPPGDSTLIANFTGSDSALFDTSFPGGGAFHLQESVTGLTASVTDGGGLLLDSFADGIRTFKVASDAGYIAFGYRAVGSTWYEFFANGPSWSLIRHDSGGPTTIGTYSSPSSLSTGQRIGVKAVGSSHQIYVGSSVAWTQTPVISVTDGTYTASGQTWFEFASAGVSITKYSSASLTAPTTAVNIYVDADHVAASDEYNRTQASNPSTPLLTPQAAGWIARSDTTWADTIVVKPSTLGNADPTNANDPDMYPQLDYRWVDRSATAQGWPMGDNAGNLPITFQGDLTNPTKPKIFRFQQRGLTNWQADSIQFGYDVGSGFDASTLASFERVTDMKFSNCLFTGGMGIAAWWAGFFRVEDCVIHAPAPPGGGNPGFHDGAGLRMEQLPNDSEGGFSVGKIYVTGTEFSNIQGDDALSVNGVLSTDPLWSVVEMHVDNCVFHNVHEINDAFHDDSIQIQSMPMVKITNSFFLGNSDAFIASDGESGTIEFSNNLVVAGGSPFQCQGTREVVLRNNSFIPTTTQRDATLLFYDRFALASRTLLTMQNNIIGGMFFRNTPRDTYFDPTSVMENNLVITDPGGVTAYGTHLAGIPELGTSDRLLVLPNDSVIQGTIPRNWELANSPSNSPGIGQGVHLADLTTDFFGRAYTNPPDVGCLQSDPGTVVLPVARPPYVLSTTPAASTIDISPDTLLSARLYPKPGNTLDLTTVNTASFYMTDPKGTVIPGTVAEAESAGVATITLHPVGGDLYPYVIYTGHLTSAVADSEGSHLDGTTTWTFQILGPYPDPAIGDLGFAERTTDLTPSGRLKPPFNSHEPLT